MSNISDFVIENGVLEKYTGPGGDVVIPDSVTSIGYRAFYWCSSLTSVVIPDSVTSIGDSAFQLCSNLKSVAIPEGVTSIGEWAFFGCSSLTSVVIPEGVTSIGEWAFSGCSSLTSVVIPEGVTSISDRAFSKCSCLTSVVIPEGVTSIGDYAFEYCSSLTSVAIPEGVTSIGDYAFEYCRNLTSVAIPDSVTSIGHGTFSGCSSLTSVAIPEGVTEIGEGTFGNCKNLAKLIINNPSVPLKSNVFLDEYPPKLVPQAAELYPHFTDGAIKTLLLTEAVWSAIPPETQAEIFMTRQGKTLYPGYISCVKDTATLGKSLLARLGDIPSAKECTAMANFMVMFSGKTDVELLRQIYERLKPLKTAAKSLKAIEEDVHLMSLLEGTASMDEALPKAEQLVAKLLLDEQLSSKDLELRLKQFYSITVKDLPTVFYKTGDKADPVVLLWLLTTHEQLISYYNGGSNYVVPDFKKPGLCPHAAEVAAELDPESFMNALRQLAKNLGLVGKSKKMFLAFPICRYADEALMAELTKMAPKWSSSVSGINAPPLFTFRKANVYSDTRAAMLFAERYDELKRYAEIRGIPEDELRDMYLSDVGLDPQGRKSYDLGNQTVAAVLQKDLSFLVELPGGKTAKSLPKKGADADKYAAANADFSELKKSVKKIVKNRKDLLFEQFLSGHSREAAAWSEAYLNNPLLRMVGSLVVWSQGKATFILSENGPIAADGTAYAIGTDPICVAHPMEMRQTDVEAWQKYLTAHGIRQPFEQMWEPVRRIEDIRPHRYKGAMIPYYRFLNREKHGIEVEDYDFHNDIQISFAGCMAEIERIDWARHDIQMDHRFEVQKFELIGGKLTRRTNHLVAYLDRCTVLSRVLKDDVSVAGMLEDFTLAQITEYIDLALKNNCTNVLALLLEHKNANYGSFDPMAEFTLEL